jgi:hypothetical protein
MTACWQDNNTKRKGNMPEKLLKYGQSLDNHAKVIDAKMYSDHPGDHYLQIVVARFQNQYVTWLYNSTFHGCTEGHYFDRLIDAVKDYEGRGRKG